MSSLAIDRPAAATLSMRQVLFCGAMIVTMSMGIRHGFGLWLQPITMDRGWSRETFAFALAIQNLAWGLAGPLAGAIADRFGALRVLFIGSVLYGLGLVLHGPGHLGAGLHRQRRTDARPGPVGHHLCGGLWRDRPQCGGGQAQLGNGRHRSRRIVRPVPDGAGGKLADRRLRLAERAVHPRLPVAADHSAGLRPERAPRSPHRPGCSKAWAKRCARPSATRASAG